MTHVHFIGIGGSGLSAIARLNNLDCAVAVQISWVLFIIGVVLVAIHVVTGRSTKVV